jgi:Zn-dependent peptidase ImmA (M78 family)
MIYEFSAYISSILEIEEPKIILEEDDAFPTPTMMGYYSSIENAVHLKKSLQIPNQCFAIAHELRHAWQIKTNVEKYLENYEIRANCNVEPYNLQLAELDANAFATCAMAKAFGVRPLFTGMNKEIVAEIFKYAEKPEIAELFQ